MKFKAGDRVEFSAKALELCDPAISANERTGTVQFYADGQPVIRFDDGTIEAYAEDLIIRVASQKHI